MRSFALILLPAVLPALAADASGQSKLFAEVHRMLPADSTLAYAVGVGDLNGDGNVDGLLSSYDLYLGRGNGVFVDDSASLPAGGYECDDVALADLDADGDLDAVLPRSLGSSSNLLLINDGAGGFTLSPGGLPSIVDDFTCVSIADVDGDADPDLLLGVSGGKPRLYANDGSAVFTDATSDLPGASYSTYDVVLFDPDGDGDADALVGNDLGSDKLFLNDGSGAFTDASMTHLPNLGPDVREYGIADLDADGDLDVVVADSFVQLLYENTGAGVFIDGSAKLVGEPLSATSVDIGDVDGDGDPDLVYGSVLENFLLLNDGAGICSFAEFHLPRTVDTTWSVTLVDVDGDGDLDNWITNSHQDRLQLNDGSGNFAQDQPNLPAFEDWTQAVLLVDASGDGAYDAVIGNEDVDRLYLGDGVGGFVGASDQLPAHASDWTACLAAGDVDGDGDLDLFTGSGLGDDRLFLNTGGANFTEASSQLPTLLLGATNEVVMQDLDADGDLDLFLSRSGSGSFARNALFLNDGTGVYVDAPGQHPADLDDTHETGAADVDGDGDTDLLLGNTYGQNRLYLNDGSALFSDATGQIPAISNNTQAVAMGDFDQDGDCDALLGNGFEQNELLWNNGSGAFVAVPGALPIAVDSTVQISLGDVDGDGHTDALLSNLAWGAEQNGLYLGDGAGGFTDGSQLLPDSEDATYALAVADIDGDGDLDVLAGNDGMFDAQQNRLYTNLTRHVAWSGLPRLDQPYDIEVFGGAGEPWFLAWGTGSASFVLPPFGTLRLDPTSILVVDGSGLLPASGTFTKTFAGPSDPAFVGVSLYWQALVGTSLLFSNLDVMTFSTL